MHTILKGIYFTCLASRIKADKWLNKNMDSDTYDDYLDVLYTLQNIDLEPYTPEDIHDSIKDMLE